MINKNSFKGHSASQADYYNKKQIGSKPFLSKTVTDNTWSSLLIALH